MSDYRMLEREPLLWLDLETTGLDPQKDSILEVFAAIVQNGVVVTLLDSRIHRAIGAPQRVMSPEVEKMHRLSGLLDVLEKEEAALHDAGIQSWFSSIKYAETCIVEGLRDLEWLRTPNVLAGFSPHFDLAFIRHHMPRLASMLSHKVFDVSTLIRAGRMLEKPALPKPSIAQHRAKADTMVAIETAAEFLQWNKSYIRAAKDLIAERNREAERVSDGLEASERERDNLRRAFEQAREPACQECHSCSFCGAQGKLSPVTAMWLENGMLHTACHACWAARHTPKNKAQEPV